MIMKRLYTFFLLTFLFSFSLAQVPPGYYNGTAGLTGPALKTKLFQIISTGTTDNGYGGLWTVMQPQIEIIFMKMTGPF